MSKTVLIIDDEVHIRKLVARMLKLQGFDVLEAINGQQGLDLLKQHHPDVVTCDITMPEFDGFDFLKAVRSQPDIKDTPVIVVTAMGQEKEILRALEMGANAYLTKPFSASRLIKVINSHLNNN